MIHHLRMYVVSAAVDRPPPLQRTDIQKLDVPPAKKKGGVKAQTTGWSRQDLDYLVRGMCRIYTYE